MEGTKKYWGQVIEQRLHSKSEWEWGTEHKPLVCFCIKFTRCLNIPGILLTRNHTNLHLEEPVPEIQQVYCKLNLCTLFYLVNTSLITLKHTESINTQLLFLWQKHFYSSTYHSWPMLACSVGTPFCNLDSFFCPPFYNFMLHEVQVFRNEWHFLFSQCYYV